MVVGVCLQHSSDQSATINNEYQHRQQMTERETHFSPVG